jgi:hypothetical protein
MTDEWLLASPPLTEDEKKSKSEVNYSEDGTVGHRCHDCMHLILHGNDPATCHVVKGIVERNDVCELFEKKIPKISH